ncbi:MAG: rhomboid family intramembrane serine protease [Spirulinaceae cyanobacterium]
MLKRQTEGLVACPSCQKIVKVTDKKCPHCDRQQPAIWGYARSIRQLGPDYGFIPVVMWGCGILYITALLLDIGGIRGSGLDLLAPSGRSLFFLGSTGSLPVYEVGRWWTVLSAGWLHGSLLHIAFNLLWIRDLAPAVARFYGGARLIIIYTAATIVGSLFSSTAGQYLDALPDVFQGATLSVGASGAIFGLFGAMVTYGQRLKNNAIAQRAWTYAIVLFVFGVIMPNVDNWGHLGGFVGGYVVTKLPSFDPLKKEGHHHLLLAIACLLATVLSIVASVVQGLFLGILWT